MQTQAGAPLSATPPDDGPIPSSPEPRRRRRVLFVVVVVAAALVLTIDQVSKSWVVANLDPSEPRDLIGSVLRLHLTFNPGAAFNLATGATWVLTLIAGGVVVVTIVTARRLGSRAWALALGLLLGGALGNLSDRIFRYPGGGRGHVVDFLELPRWPIFNVADMAVVSAAVLIALLAFSGIGIDGKRAGSGAGKHEAPRDKGSGEKPPEAQRPDEQLPEGTLTDEQASEDQPAGRSQDDTASPDRKDGNG
jgi:signal peptidase II